MAAEANDDNLEVVEVNWGEGMDEKWYRGVVVDTSEKDSKILVRYEDGSSRWHARDPTNVRAPEAPVTTKKEGKKRSMEIKINSSGDHMDTDGPVSLKPPTSKSKPSKSSLRKPLNMKLAKRFSLKSLNTDPGGYTNHGSSSPRSSKLPLSAALKKRKKNLSLSVHPEEADSPINSQIPQPLTPNFDTLSLKNDPFWDSRPSSPSQSQSSSPQFSGRSFHSSSERSGSGSSLGDLRTRIDSGLLNVGAVHSGELLKFANLSFKPRWFQIYQGRLRYFTDDRCQKVLGHLDLSHVTQLEPDKRKKHGFVISAGGRKYVLGASSDMERDLWINVLCDYICKAHQGVYCLGYHSTKIVDDIGFNVKTPTGRRAWKKRHVVLTTKSILIFNNQKDGDLFTRMCFYTQPSYEKAFNQYVIAEIKLHECDVQPCLPFRVVEKTGVAYRYSPNIEDRVKPKAGVYSGDVVFAVRVEGDWIQKDTDRWLPFRIGDDEFFQGFDFDGRKHCILIRTTKGNTFLETSSEMDKDAWIAKIARLTQYNHTAASSISIPESQEEDISLKEESKSEFAGVNGNGSFLPIESDNAAIIEHTFKTYASSFLEDTPAPELQGYFKKKTDEMLKTWQRHYFRLFEDALVWYKDESALRPQGVLPLYCINLVELEDDLTLSVTITDQDIITLRFDNEEQSDEWNQTLSSVWGRYILGSESAISIMSTTSNSSSIKSTRSTPSSSPRSNHRYNKHSGGGLAREFPLPGAPTHANKDSLSIPSRHQKSHSLSSISHKIQSSIGGSDDDPKKPIERPPPPPGPVPQEIKDRYPAESLSRFRKKNKQSLEMEIAKRDRSDSYDATIEQKSTPAASIIEGRKLFVGGLSPITTDDGFKYFFKKFGEVEQTSVVREPNGTSRGVGFVTFKSKAIADEIIQEQDLIFDGNALYAVQASFQWGSDIPSLKGVIANWTVDDVLKWLESIQKIQNIKHVRDTFRDNDVDGETLWTLTNTDLKNELDMNSYGDRQKVLKALSDLRGPVSQTQTSRRGIFGGVRARMTSNRTANNNLAIYRRGKRRTSIGDMNEEEQKTSSDTPRQPWKWTTEEVCEWLLGLNLGQYVPDFEKWKIADYSFVNLTDEHLEKVGVKNSKHRQIMLEQISIFSSLMQDATSPQQSYTLTSALPNRDLLGTVDEDTMKNRMGSIEFQPNRGMMINDSSEKTVSAKQQFRDYDLTALIMDGIGTILAQPLSSESSACMDFQEVRYFRLNFEDVNFSIKDYAPLTFRSIRELYGITKTQFKDSLCDRGIAGGGQGAGKSGQLFWFSKDGRFILKTITHAELKFFRTSFMDSYYNHLVNNPHTFLCRFYGLHKVLIPNDRTFYFVIMNNVFDTPLSIDQKFDLKGSTRGREVKEEDASVKKDLNLHEQMYIGPTQKEACIQQLNKDVDLLFDAQIMDYSLLLGIHDGNDEDGERGRGMSFHIATELEVEVRHERRQTLDEFMAENDPDIFKLSEFCAKKSMLTHGILSKGDKKVSIFSNCEGGLRSFKSDEPAQKVYFLGVIDILQEWNTKKKLENALKRTLYDHDSISAVECERYATRFKNFVASRME